jgi:hypothetical protein
MKSPMTKEKWELLFDRLDSIGHGYDVKICHKCTKHGVELKMLDEEDVEVCDALVSEVGEFQNQVIFKYADDEQNCFVSSASAIFALMYT